MLEDWGALWNRHGVRYDGGKGTALGFYAFFLISL